MPDSSQFEALDVSGLRKTDVGIKIAIATQVMVVNQCITALGSAYTYETMAAALNQVTSSIDALKAMLSPYLKGDNFWVQNIREAEAAQQAGLISHQTARTKGVSADAMDNYLKSNEQEVKRKFELARYESIMEFMAVNRIYGLELSVTDKVGF